MRPIAAASPPSMMSCAQTFSTTAAGTDVP